jgi:hypothetical protein
MQRELIPTEEQEHIVLADWLTLHGILFHHSPNEGSRSKRVDRHGRVWSPEGNRLKRMGVKKGFPDFVILDSPPVAIELKRRREAFSRKAVAENRVATPEQKWWLDQLTERGWHVAVCYGADEAIALLKQLGYGRRTA